MLVNARLTIGALLLVLAALFVSPSLVVATVPPTAAGSGAATQQNTPVTISLNITDPDSLTVTVSIVTPPSHGTLGPVSVANCLGTGKAGSGYCGASVLYTPAPGFAGPDGFTFKANDGTADSNIATVSITVNAPANSPPSPTKGIPQGPGGGPTTPNLAPSAASQTASTSLNTARPLSLSAADPDSPSLVFTVLTPPLHGTLSPLAAPVCTPSGTGANCSDAVTYTPTPGYTGPDSFTFKANDGALDSNTATIGLTVSNAAGTGVAAPVSNSLNVGTTVSTPRAVTLSASDADSPALSFSVVFAPAHGTLGVLSAPSCTPAGPGSNCTATVTYTPTALYTGGDSFSFKTNDGSQDSNVAVVNITVSAGPPPSQAPTASSQSLGVAHNTATPGSLAGADGDSPSLTFTIVTGPSHGTLGAIGTPVCTPASGGSACTASVIYTPTAGYSGPDAFAFRVNDGALNSNTATVSLTVAVGAAPTAVAQTASTSVNTAKTLTLTGADTDSPGLTFAIVTPPGHGTLGTLGAPNCIPAGGGTTCTSTVTYTPTTGYTGPDSFSFKTNDGTRDSAPAIVTITVSAGPANSSPTATPQSMTAQVNTAKPITLAGADTDSPSLTFSIVSGPSHGTLSPLGAPVCTPAGGGSNCTSTTTYTPATGYSGPDAFSFKTNDGSSDSNIATVSITVSSNAAPVVTTTAGSSAFTEGSAAVVVDSGATVTDADSAGLSSATVSITNLLNAGQETLAVTTTDTSITAGYVAPTLTLTGADTLAHYQQVLRSVTYTNASQNPATTSRVIAFSATDNTSLVSNVANKTVTITAVNQAPVVTTSAGATAFTEGAGPVAVDASVNVTDVDNANLASASVTITNLLDGASESLAATVTGTSITAVYTAGTGVLALTGSDTLAHYQQVKRSVTYNNTSVNPTTTARVIRFVANDGTANSANADKNATIAGVNNSPVITLSASAPGFTEGGTAAVVDNALTVTDPDSANLISSTITITNLLDLGTETLAANTAGTSITASYVTPALSLSGTDTVAHFQQVLRTVAYSNASQNPSPVPRVVRFVANDGTANSNAADKTITLTPLDQAPEITATAGTTTFHSGGGPLGVDAGLILTDVDSANLASATITILSGQVDGASEVLDATVPNSISKTYGAGALTLTGSDTLANYVTYLRSVTYNNTAVSPTSGSRMVRVIANDGTLSSSPADKIVDVTIALPIPGSDSYTATGNLKISVQQAFGVLGNDSGGTLAKYGATTMAPQPNTVVNETNTVTTNNGGTVLLKLDGSFTYDPPVGFTGTDHFYYVLSNAGGYSNDGNGTDVAIAVSEMAWFIDNNAGRCVASCDGRFTHPFTSVADFQAINDGLSNHPANNHVIFIYESATSYSGNLVLRNGQRLIGQDCTNFYYQGTLLGAHDFLFCSGILTTPLYSLGPAINPTSTNVSLTAATGSPITLTSDNTLSGFSLANSVAPSVKGSNFGTLVATDVAIVNGAGPALDLTNGTTIAYFPTLSGKGVSGASSAVHYNGVSGTTTAFAGALTNSAGADVLQLQNGSVDFKYGGTITNSASSTQAVLTQGNLAGTVEITNAVTDNGGAGKGVLMSGNSGTFALKLTGGLNLITGANSAFGVTGGGTVTICDKNPCGSVNSVDNTLSTTTATALSITSTNIGAAGVTFRSISAGTASGTSGDGIILDSTGSLGSLTVTGTGGAATGGTIQHKTGVDGSTAQGIGIYLNATKRPSFSWMQLNDFDNFAVYGSNVTGLALDHVVINGANGTLQSGSGEGDAYFAGLSGSASVANSAFSGAAYDGFHVANNGESLDRITITNSSFAVTNSGGRNAVTLQATNGIFNATVQSSSFTAARYNLFSIDLYGTGSSDLVFGGASSALGNTLSNNAPQIADGFGGLRIDNATAGLTFNIANNTMQSAHGPAVEVARGAGNTGSITGTIDHNQIQVDAGFSVSGRGISVDHAGGTTTTVAITNNTVTALSPFSGFAIWVRIGGHTTGNGYMDATIQGNEVALYDTQDNGIRVEIGSELDDAHKACLTIGGSGAQQNTVGGWHDNFSEIDIFLFQNGQTHLGLPGLATTSTTGTGVIALLHANNALEGFVDFYASGTGLFKGTCPPP